jgi:hypothetical protein
MARHLRFLLILSALIFPSLALQLTLTETFLADGALAADYESYTYKLSQSTASYLFWTTTPSERIFKDSAVPTATGSGVKAYAARNEFEPFQVVVRPAASGNVTVNVGNFGSGIKTEIYQVKYVNVITATLCGRCQTGQPLP